MLPKQNHLRGFFSEEGDFQLDLFSKPDVSRAPTQMGDPGDPDFFTVEDYGVEIQPE